MYRYNRIINDDHSSWFNEEVKFVIFGEKNRFTGISRLF